MMKRRQETGKQRNNKDMASQHTGGPARPQSLFSKSKQGSEDFPGKSQKSLRLIHRKDEHVRKGLGNLGLDFTLQK